MAKGISFIVLNILALIYKEKSERLISSDLNSKTMEFKIRSLECYY